MVECDLCGHAPIKHIPDGLKGWKCLVCELMVAKQIIIGGFLPTLCTQQMKFQLSAEEREQAAKADRGSFPPHVVCAMCLHTWEGHMGFLCPTGDSTFVVMLDAGQDYRA